MTHLIDKDALVAKIERLMYGANLEADIASTGECFNEEVADAKYQLCKLILSIINTLEVKEVDLEKELDSMITPELKLHKALPSLFDVAKHFFELGLKAQNDNIRHSMDETPNYPCDILLVTDVDNIFLCRYMENGRPVDRETPYFRGIENGKCWYYCNDIMNIH